MTKPNSREVFNPLEYALPRVTQDIVIGMRHSAKDMGMKKYDQEMVARIMVNNPVLLEVIAQFIEYGDLDDDKARIAVDAMVLTHEVLQKQAEANALNKGIA